MATDGVKITDGDLAADTYSIFMEMYDAGASLDEIKRAVEQPFDEEDGFDYEIYITVYALALWQTGQLTADILQEVDEAITRGAGVKVWLEECGYKEGRGRQRELEKLKEKLNRPNLRIRKRRIYKPVNKFIFEEDAVLVFQLAGGNYGVAILMEVAQYQGRATYHFIAPAYMGSHKPTIETIEGGEIPVRKMPAGFDYQIGFSINAISPKILRSFAAKLEQIGKLKIRSELKKVGSYGGVQDFESFCQIWENQELRSKNLSMDNIPLQELL